VFHRECAHEVSPKACINSGPQRVQFEGFTLNSALSEMSPKFGNQLTAEHRLGSWLVAGKGRKFLQQPQGRLTKPNPWI